MQPRWLLTVVEKGEEPCANGDKVEGALSSREANDGDSATPMEADDETAAQKEAIAARLEGEEDLRMMPVPVRVGEAVDVVAQVGRQPKTITGFQTHTAPVLLSFTERAELGTDECKSQTQMHASLAKRRALTCPSPKGVSVPSREKEECVLALCSLFAADLPVASVLEGLVFLRKNPEYKPPKPL